MIEFEGGTRVRVDGDVWLAVLTYGDEWLRHCAEDLASCRGAYRPSAVDACRHSGPAARLMRPPVEAFRHVMADVRVHAGNTVVPVLLPGLGTPASAAPKSGCAFVLSTRHL